MNVKDEYIADFMRFHGVDLKTERYLNAGFLECRIV